MKKSLFAMLLAFIMVFASAATVVSEGGEVLVRTSFTAGEFTDDIIAQANAELPGIKVERDEADDTRLMAMIAAGTAPDVIRIYAAQTLPLWVTRGIAMNIQEYVDKSEVINEDDLLSVADVFRWDGQKSGQGPLYGIPKDWSLDLTVMINKSHFENAGLEIPDEGVPMTLQQYADFAKAIYVANDDGSPKVYGSGNYQFNFNNLMLVQSLLQQQGKSIWSEDYKTVSLNNDDVKYIFNILYDLNLSMTNVSPLNPAPSWDGDLFAGNQLGIMTTGYWYTGVVRGFNRTETQMSDLEIVQEDCMMLPAIMIDESASRLSACTHACGGILLAQSENPDEAWRVFEWFLGPGKQAQARAAGGWGLPAYRSLMDLLPTETDFDKQTLRVTLDELEKSSQVYVQMNPYVNYAAIESLINKYVDPIYFGESTIEDALPLLERDIQLLIDEGMEVAGVR